MQMDPQLTGILIGAAGVALGSLLTVLGNVLTTVFTSRREAKQWERQQIADRDKRRHEEKTAERIRRREMFQNALTHLSTLISRQHDELSPSKEEYVQRIEEAEKWLNLLSLSYSADEEEIKFHSVLEEFIANPFGYAGDMREEVVKLSKTDRLLFPDPRKEPKLITAKVEPQRIEFRMEIDDDFRRQQMIKAIEVPLTYTFSCQLSELTETQRELLVNIYYPTRKGIPSNLQLPMPSASPYPKQPYTSGLHWKGRVNPGKSTYSEMLAMWEHDYKESFEKVNAVGPQA